MEGAFAAWPLCAVCFGNAMGYELFTKPAEVRLQAFGGCTDYGEHRRGRVRRRSATHSSQSRMGRADARCISPVHFRLCCQP
jgi:hypothetical protein